ncbi:MAG: DUF3108 domain-containing protein [Acidobacteria bacterium]|nr:DUF3108 domain-containing protein [Acidobacteriota bacterium]
MSLIIKDPTKYLTAMLWFAAAAFIFAVSPEVHFAQTEREKTEKEKAEARQKEEAKKKEIAVVEAGVKDVDDKEAAAKEAAAKEAASRDAGSRGPAKIGAPPSETATRPADKLLKTSKLRVGEKFSYTLSFGPSENAGVADIGITSSGKIEGRDALELRANIKTVELISAAFIKLDETRTTYLDAATGLPLFSGRVDRTGPLPVSTSSSFFKEAAVDHDLLSLIYAIRNAGGSGSFTVREGGAVHSVMAQNAGTIRSWTPLGVFETVIVRIESDLFASRGITDLAIHFSADDRMIPVVIRCRTDRGQFRAVLSTITEPAVEPAATPTPVPTPTPVRSPTPAPVTYIPNQPLLTELGFELGENLEFRVFYGGRPAGRVRLNAERRDMIDKVDTLILRAAVAGVEPGNPGLRMGDTAVAHVDPDTLATRKFESKFDSLFPALNQSVLFDSLTGKATFGSETVDIPLGTHSMVSLLYAMRSFNLKPSKDAGNPVNDTRVAVFWENRAYVFTLRPSAPEVITINGEKVAAQLISFQTGVPALDSLQIKVWIAAQSRVPLRFLAGQYQADITVNPKALE